MLINRLENWIDDLERQLRQASYRAPEYYELKIRIDTAYTALQMAREAH